MFAVIFEVNPRPEAWDDYLSNAAILRRGTAIARGRLFNDR